jgi:hypothetical protein
MSIKNYHGYFGYNWTQRQQGAAVRAWYPAPRAGSGTSRWPNGPQHRLVDEVLTTGAGVKMMASPHFESARGAVDAHLRQERRGWWCGPYRRYSWPNAQYANQFGFNGGVSLRF